MKNQFWMTLRQGNAWPDSAIMLLILWLEAAKDVVVVKKYKFILESWLWGETRGEQIKWTKRL